MLTVLTGDALEQLRTLPDESVQCCVTSPPYWGLRDYGTAAWEGGNDFCDHKIPATGGNPLQGANKGNNNFEAMPFKSQCLKCGAKRIDSQLGLEKTPEEYVAKMVDVFREVRRVLRRDGTLWLNLGSSYAQERGGRSEGSHGGGVGRAEAPNNGSVKPPCGFKAKDLVPIPWMVAMALQADGWWLRSDIIWAKPNPMPESVTDRPTKSHEYLFLLTKSANYFYDAEAIKERGVQKDMDRPRNGRVIGNPSIEVRGGNSGVMLGVGTENRNKRSVWTIPTHSYPESHFATYPPDLIKPCIMAGSRVGDTILDPFAGSGTTGMVALELGRKAVLIELNPKYCKLIHQRCNVTMGLALA